MLKEPKVNMQMMNSIMDVEEDSYGIQNIGGHKKGYDILRVLKNRDVIASTSSLDPDNDESEKIRQTVIAKSRKFYANNKKLLKSLVVSKVASIMKKGEWESMIGDEEHKLRTVVQNYISRFEIFKTTFVSANKKLLEDIKIYLRDNLQKFMRDKIESKSRDTFLQEMKEMALSIEMLILDQKNLKNIKDFSKKIEELELKRLGLVKQLEELKSELEKLQSIRTRGSHVLGSKTPRNKGKILTD